MFQNHKSAFEGKQIHSVAILIVEDDVDIGQFLNNALVDEGYRQVMLAANSKDALNIIKNAKLNLFILDYHLPYMDGFELYKKIHMLDRFKDIPAIIMSAYLPFQIKRELIDYNAVYIEKPFELEHFINVVRKVLDRKPI